MKTLYFRVYIHPRTKWAYYQWRNKKLMPNKVATKTVILKNEQE